MNDNITLYISCITTQTRSKRYAANTQKSCRNMTWTPVCDFHCKQCPTINMVFKRWFNQPGYTICIDSIAVNILIILNDVKVNADSKYFRMLPYWRFTLLCKHTQCYFDKFQGCSTVHMLWQLIFRHLGHTNGGWFVIIASSVLTSQLKKHKVLERPMQYARGFIVICSLLH